MKYLCKLSNLFVVLALLAGLLGLAQPAQAYAPLRADMWVTNGTVYATLLSGSTLYIGGEFSYVGPPTGSFTALDAGGVPDMAFPPIDGTIYSIVPDGTGGWYVGGIFTSVGGHPRNNLVHIKADKSLDFAWNPNPSAQVQTLALSGSTLYVGGKFTTIGGQTRNYLAALDTGTGLATAWNPNPDNMVWALWVNGSTIYVGGQFWTIGGQARNSIAELNTSTGLPTSWNPNANSGVFALVANGSTIYAGGVFTSIGGQSRNFIAALDAVTGKATTWDPKADYGTVWTLAIVPTPSGASSTTIYVGGSFTNIGGQPRNRIAALDTGTGKATAWNPNSGGQVLALAIAPPISGGSPNLIYAAGSFTSIGGQPRNYIAALDAGTGLATTWDPSTSDLVFSVAVEPPISGASGSTIYAGGKFNSAGGQIRNRIAALDTSTGLATAWNPNANGTVCALAVIDSTIYAGGWFGNIGGQARSRIAALDASTGLATSWNPGTDGSVLTLAVAPPISGGSSSTLYVGGTFANMGGKARNNIAALDTNSDNATDWNPNASGPVSSGSVLTLAVSDSAIYAGGWFTSIGGKARNYIAALDAGTGLATLWDPNASHIVQALAVAPPIPGVTSGGTIYAGGLFSTIGGQNRGRIAALDASSGLATAWNPSFIGGVQALVVVPPIPGVSGTKIYVGGGFTNISGWARNNIAVFDTSSGNPTIWNPNTNGSVIALAVAPASSGGNSSTIYAGGYFTSTGGQPIRGLAALRDGAAACQSTSSGGSWRVSNWSNCDGTIPGDGDSVEIQPGHALTVYNSLMLNNLTIAAGGELELPLGSMLSVDGTLTHNGRLTQTLAVPSAMAFLNIKNATGTTNKLLGAILIPAANMGNTTVTIRGNQNCTGDSGVKRCFDISPTTPQNATVRLYYTNAELNGQTYNDLKLWHWSAGWAQAGDTYTYSATCNAGQINCWIEAKNVSAYSPFGIGSSKQPTAVRMQSFAARTIPAEGGLALAGLLLLALCGLGLFKIRR